jgi:hypothetical protein
MKNEGFRGCENISKLKQLLSEFQSRLFENQGTRFTLHSLLYQLDITTGYYYEPGIITLITLLLQPVPRGTIRDSGSHASSVVPYQQD